MTSDAVLLGADVGGSRTRVAVGRGAPAVLAEVEGAGAVMRAGRGDETAGVVADLARRATAQAGVSLPAEAIVIGAAGAGGELEQAELAASVLRTGIARRVQATTDGEIALAAAFEGAPGVLLNAGTGTIAYARDPAGRVHRAGGYGWQMGDEGSGYWLGRRALELAGQAFDGRGGSTGLLARVLAALQLPAFDGLVRWSVNARPAEVAALAPIVLRAAEEGDAAARAAAEEAGGQLAALVASLAGRFPDAGPVTVAVTGGLFSSDSSLSTAFDRALVARVTHARVVRRPFDPAAAALTLAARLMEEG